MAWRWEREIRVGPVLVTTRIIRRGDLIDEALVESEQVLVVEHEWYNWDFFLDRGTFTNAGVVDKGAWGRLAPCFSTIGDNNKDRCVR